MKVVFYSLFAHGHINPTLGVVKELIKRGHKVIYYSGSEFKEKIKNTGATFIPYNLPQIDISHIPPNSLKLLVLLLDITSGLLPLLVKEAKEIGPSCIMHDSFALWGWIMARHMGIPGIDSITTFALNLPILRRITHGSIIKRIIQDPYSHIGVLRKKRALEKKYGVRIRLSNIILNPERLNIIYTSREFQPFSQEFDNTYKFVGPSILEERDEGESILELPERKTIIYISLGTVRNKSPKFFKGCIEALSGSPYHIVMSLGKGINIEELGKIPSNFTVRNFVPQIEVLKRSSLFITHGGMNSVHEALWFGIPMVLFPQTPEQMLISRRVEVMGAGKVMEEASSKTIKKYVEEVLDNPSYKKAANNLSLSLKASGGYKRAVDEIEGFCATLP